MFDTDGSGSITIDELMKAFGASGDEDIDEWQQIINEVDLDGNGEIEFDEFKLMMQKLVIKGKF